LVYSSIVPAGGVVCFDVRLWSLSIHSTRPDMSSDSSHIHTSARLTAEHHPFFGFLPALFFCFLMVFVFLFVFVFDGSTTTDDDAHHRSDQLTPDHPTLYSFLLLHHRQKPKPYPYITKTLIYNLRTVGHNMAKRQRPSFPLPFRIRSILSPLSLPLPLLLLLMMMVLPLLLQVHRYSVSSFRFLRVPATASTSFGRSRSLSRSCIAKPRPCFSSRRFQHQFSLSLSLPATTTTTSSSFSTTDSSNQDNNKQENDVVAVENWRSHPSINPTLIFPTWLVPSSSLQKLLKEPLLQRYLANRDDYDSSSSEISSSTTNNILQHIHPRIKIIQDYSKTHKLLLRRLRRLDDDDHDYNDDALQQCLQAHEVQDGPELTMDISYKQLSFSYILSQLLPNRNTAAPPTAFEQIGHVAHFNLKPQHVPYGTLIGQVLVDTNPAIETVVSKVGQVSGPFRTYQLEVLAGPHVTQTTLVEHGLSVALDVATCYWCTRLSGERQVLLSEIQPGQVVADVFSGVGTLCLLANRDKNCTVLANDWNPSAIEFFHKNIETNGLRKDDFDLNCGDTYDYLTDLGLQKEQKKVRHPGQRPQQHQQHQQHRLPDHVVMNFPLEAPKFLGALRWWPSKKVDEHYHQHGSYPRVHVYTFARGDTEGKSSGGEEPPPRRTEEQVAVDQIANELLPEFTESSTTGGTDTSIDEPPGNTFRQEEMDQGYGTQFQTRVVRDVAPGKVVVCVSFSITPKLLRFMQGDYS
jgi:tRNA G37 N-methylase Trm5